LTHEAPLAPRNLRPRQVSVDARFAGQAQDALAEDIAHDLRRATFDRVGARPQEQLARRAGLPAVATATPPEVPQGQGAAVEGATLYVAYGCINCHGPNGLGGVPNPQSPDKTIPPLSGLTFRNEFNTDAKIEAVIRSGSVIGRAPIVSMPHWGGIIPADQLEALTAYIKTLKTG